ncbi:hypothetical protein [Agaribacter flavus]|uniref:Outer membrane protein beta-barrel domain-containing protein n=1 Tax=Agaribacter flavus TaxID=1902781 RepID=A0ABV7FN65_9ALTE
MKGIVIVLFFSALCISNAKADQGFYGIISLGYAQSDLVDLELDSASYKLGIGYELAPKWYLEAGFQSLGEENVGELPSVDGINTEYSALYLSALGKAQGAYGELFYRLGVMQVSSTIESVPSSEGCQVPQQLSTRPLGQLCAFDQSLVAGQFGLGFDFYIHHSTILRTEIEWLKGQEDYSAAAVYLGVRLNF